MAVWIEWRSIRFQRPDAYEIETITHYEHPPTLNRPARSGSILSTTYLGISDIASMHPELLPFAWWAKKRWLDKMSAPLRRRNPDHPPPGPWIPVDFARPPRISAEPEYTKGQPYARRHHPARDPHF